MENVSDPAPSALQTSSGVVRLYNRVGKEFGHQLRPAIVAFVMLTVITGCFFSSAILGMGAWIFPDQGGGSLIRMDGRTIGSSLIGQSFTGAPYFHPRPSAAGKGYDATASGGTNDATTSLQFIRRVRQAAQAYRQENGLSPGTIIPVDAVTTSASGLDPEITLDNATLQVPRVARSRKVRDATVRQLLRIYTQGPQLGFLGQTRISVLQLNLALDHMAAGHD